MTKQEMVLTLKTLKACEWYIPDDKHELMFNTNKCENIIILELKQLEENSGVVQPGGTLPS